MQPAARTQLLEAMGYRLFVRAAASSPPAEPARPATAAAPAPAPIAVAPAPTATPVAVVDDRLWQAVLAAAGLDPARADALGWRFSTSGRAVEYVRDELWLDPRALARDPRAKRQLWKTLRALRRRELGRRAP